MFVAELSKLNDILGLLQKEYNVFVPVIAENVSGFVPLSKDNQAVYLENQTAQLNTVPINLHENVLASPKQHFFPQTEGLYRFKTAKNSVNMQSLPANKEKHLLFGVRSCDMKSLDCLDQVFLTKGFVDSFYKAKRDHTVIIALGCNEPGRTCFCSSMGVDPQKAKGADVQAYLNNETIRFEALTPAGEHIVGLMQSALKPSPASDAAASYSEFVPEGGKFNLKVDSAGVAAKLKNMFDSALWDEIARKCLNCGACTYICPTCHCFDISQDVRGEEGVKYRCWDSCMFKEYTQMAGGHNPRSGKMEKIRNRFMHKLKFFMERYDMMLCTGCGRCIEVCPVGMDITAVIRKIKEAE